MPAGLPGTGLGGLFLILSALLMPLVELRRRVGGRTGLGRWRLVGRHTALAIGMVAVVVGPIGALYWALLGSSPTQGGASARNAGANLHGGAMAPPVAPILIALVALVGIIIIAYALKLILLFPARPEIHVRSSDITASRVESSDCPVRTTAASTLQFPGSSHDTPLSALSEKQEEALNAVGWSGTPSPVADAGTEREAMEPRRLAGARLAAALVALLPVGARARTALLLVASAAALVRSLRLQRRR